MELFSFSLCENSMGISNKLAKHNNQYLKLKKKEKRKKEKKVETTHNQDTKFLRGKPFNGKGKTTRPSPVKSSTIE